MRSLKYQSIIITFTIFFSTIFSGCKQWTNFTTYYNTYYNENRLIEESEDEFEYQDEKRRIKPRVFITQPSVKLPAIPKSGPPPFMQEFIIDQQKLQPVQTKLDSVIVKGSKILARRGNSNYIEGSLYLMAKAYFYKREWLPAEIKCSELIDKFPLGELNPDAHLLLCKALLIQQKFLAGKVMLSRTVDIGWFKKRYDILSEAFKMEAELALYENDLNAALRPYRQAIAQTEDNTIRAKWLVDMGALYYRVGKFEEAEKTFAKVRNFSPDYMAEFESYIYQAQCLVRLERYKEADEILNKVENDVKYEEWKADAFAVRMVEMRMQNKDEEFKNAEHKADTGFANNPAIMAVYYEAGMDQFQQNNYSEARRYFAKAKNQKSELFASSDKMFNLLNQWEQKKTSATPLLNRYFNNDTMSVKEKSQLAQNLFELGRIHEQFGNSDSVLLYYELATESSPAEDTNSARYIYAYSRVMEKNDPIFL